MTSSTNEVNEQEKKNTTEAQNKDQETEKVDEAAANTTTEDSKSSNTTPKSSKKKKKKRDSSATAETKKGEDDKDKNVTENGKDNTVEKDDAKTEKTSSVEGDAGKESDAARNDLSSGPVVSVTKRTRPPYKYDPEKVTLRFLFANRDGLTVTVECKPSDTVGEVKGRLLSVWPKDLQSCSSGDQLRLICMGKGMLIPDNRTLQDCEVPVFKTHPTPVNVAVRPISTSSDNYKSGKDGGARGGGSSGSSNNRISEQSGQGCGCIIS